MSNPAVSITDLHLSVRVARRDRQLIGRRGQRLVLPRERYLTFDVDLNLIVPGDLNIFTAAFATTEEQLIRTYFVPEISFRELIAIEPRHRWWLSRLIQTDSAGVLRQLVGGGNSLLGGLSLRCDGVSSDPSPLLYDDKKGDSLPNLGETADFAGALFQWNLPRTNAPTRLLQLHFEIPQLRGYGGFPIMLRQNTELEHLVVGLEDVDGAIELWEVMHPAEMRLIRTADRRLDHWFDLDQRDADDWLAYQVAWGA